MKSEERATETQIREESISELEKEMEEERDKEKTEEPYRGMVVKLTGRPKRDKIIDDDDIRNLKIALETAKTVEEFLSLV